MVGIYAIEIPNVYEMVFTSIRILMVNCTATDVTIICSSTVKSHRVVKPWNTLAIAMADWFTEAQTG
jgi:hypothetical protein